MKSPAGLEAAPKGKQVFKNFKTGPIETMLKEESDE
jgi:hypothetical protein